MLIELLSFVQSDSLSGLLKSLPEFILASYVTNHGILKMPSAELTRLQTFAMSTSRD